MSFSDLTVQGYRYHDVAFVAVVDDAKPGKKLNALELRDFGLDGGEIHLSLKEGNRAVGDEGVWYAIKCTNTKTLDKNDQMGTIAIKQLDADYRELNAKVVPLEELDNGHLIDRLISECLHFHAESFGPGPHASPEVATRKSRKVRA
jgi:hypothetical protein